jgi:hypothetical protein
MAMLPVSMLVTMLVTVVVRVIVVVVTVVMAGFMPVLMRMVVLVQLQENDPHHRVRPWLQAQHVLAAVQVERPGPLEWQGPVQEARLDRQLVVQVERMDVEDLVHVEVAVRGAMKPGDAIDGT